MSAANDIVKRLLEDDDVDPKVEVERYDQERRLGLPDRDNLSPFLNGYIEAALFSTNDESTPSGGYPLDQNYDASDLSDETLRSMAQDCQEFQEKYADLLSQAGDETQNGRDFWFSRNGHGVGFFDRGYPDEIGTALQDAASAYGEDYLHVGDDGHIYNL